MAFIYNESSARDLGLPVLSKDEIPSCGTDVVIPACSRDGMFSMLRVSVNLLIDTSQNSSNKSKLSTL
jgi:hypothetical protein